MVATNTLELNQGHIGGSIVDFSIPRFPKASSACSEVNCEESWRGILQGIQLIELRNVRTNVHCPEYLKETLAYTNVQITG